MKFNLKRSSDLHYDDQATATKKSWHNQSTATEVEFDTMDDLLAFIAKNGIVIITEVTADDRKHWPDEHQHGWNIEIYDEYRE